MHKLCKSRNIGKSYLRESYKNMKIHKAKHCKGLKNKKDTNVLYKHVMNDHKDEEEKVDFEMIKTGTFRKAISRQINEGIRLKNEENHTLLNSKSEFHGPSIGRKALEGRQFKCKWCKYTCKTDICMKAHMRDVHIEKSGNHRPELFPPQVI